MELDEEALKQLKDKVVNVVAGLEALLEPRVLLFTNRKACSSEPSEVLHSARRRRRERVPLTEGRVASAIYSDRVIIGRETIEIRHEAESRLPAC